jgi:hypothetical protein
MVIKGVELPLGHRHQILTNATCISGETSVSQEKASPLNLLAENTVVTKDDKGIPTTTFNAMSAFTQCEGTLIVSSYILGFDLAVDYIDVNNISIDFELRTQLHVDDETITKGETIYHPPGPITILSSPVLTQELPKLIYTNITKDSEFEQILGGFEKTKFIRLISPITIPSLKFDLNKQLVLTTNGTRLGNDIESSNSFF